MSLEPVNLSVLLFSIVLMIGLVFVWWKRPLPVSLKRFDLTWTPIFAILLAAVFSFMNLLPAAAQGDSVSVEKTFSGGGTYLQVQSGEVFEYEIRYTCALITQNANCDDATITDDLPPELEYVNFAPAPGTNISYDPVLHRVTITFPDGIALGQDGLNAGDTGLIVFRVRFIPGTLGSVTADNTATITATAAGVPLSDTSDPITAETLPGTFQMTVQKSHQNTAEAGVIDVPPALVFQTVYDINVCGPTDIGGVNMLNAIITDTLPAEATFISAADSGAYDPVTHSVVWGPMTITVGACFNTSVTVGFDPDGPDGLPGTGDEPVAGNTATNNVVVTGDPENGDPSVNLPGSDTLTLSQPNYASSFSKSSSSPSSYTGRPTEELAGGPVTYDMAIDNTGTITLTNVIVTDTVPASHTVTAITVGPATDPVNAYYQSSDNPGVWVAFPGNAYTAAATVPVTTTATADPNDIELNPGAYVTDIRWEFGDIPVGAPAGAAGFTATLDPALTPGTTLQNCADVGLLAYNFGTNSYDAHTDQACADVTIIDQRSIPRPVKTGGGEYFPEEVIDYELRYVNPDVAHLPVNAPLSLSDVLPAELEVVVYDPGNPASDDFGYRPAVVTDAWYTFSAITNTLPAPAPTATLQTGFNPNGDTLLRWDWGVPYTLSPGEELIVNFQARVKRGTPPGTFNNSAIVLWDGSTQNPLLCPSGDGNLNYIDSQDVDQDGNTTEQGCQTPGNSVTVRAFLKMESEKFIMGARDGGVWNKDGLTVPGGDVDYRMVITNSSNVTATNIVVYDILPFVGDTGVINTIPRLSEWRPNMQGITDNGYPVTIYYSQSGTPCRPEVMPSGPPGCVNDWSTTPPTDFTSVQAIKLEFCDAGGCLELAPDTGTGNGGSLEFTWDMVAPNDAPADPARAWNSFGFSATDISGSLSLLPAEPNKVGIRVEYNPTGVSLGNYVWFDVAGQQDDGIQQPQEIGVNGVRVELWNPGPDGVPNTGDDTPYDLDSTPGVDYRITGLDGNGNPGYYLFYDLPPGNTYSLRFFPPVGYTISPANTPPDDALDSDGELMGIDATYGNYWQTAPITFTAGITEDLTWDQGIWLPTDYGDAPSPYPTEAASLGATPELAARHVISAGLHMGSLVDAELDGQPDADAWGDDNSGSPDDEDGVTFASYLGTPANPSGILIPGEDNNITISTTVPAGVTAYLNAWIDYNQNGNWDAGEQIATDVATTGGNTTLTVAVPAGLSGSTYARFRLSTEMGLLPTGTAMDGEVEDYQVQFVPPPVKTLVFTSEAHTADDFTGNGTRLAIGEIVRYRLMAAIPEGTMTNFEFRDRLPGGLLFLDDGTTTVSVTATTTITHDPLTISPISGSGFVSGRDPVFQLGTVVNNDSDNDEEYVTIEFNALVLNNGGLTTNDFGEIRDNRFDVNYDTYTDRSNQVRIHIAEPLVTLAKTVTTTPTDAGDTVVYELTATAATGVNRATAFDLVITDTLDTSLVLQSVSVNAPGYATPTDNSNILLNQLDVGIDRLDRGDSVTVTITATVNANEFAGETIPNTGNLTWTSLSGNNGTTPNPTGSTTPGNSGDDNGERDGSGANQNDYNDNANAPVTLADPLFDKLPPSPTDYTIGENVTFTLTITLPEGVTQDLMILDDLPAGLDYVSYQIITTAAASGGLLVADFNGTLPAPTVTAPGGSGADVTWDFGNTTTTDDNATNNNTFLIQVTAVVLNQMSNQDNVTLTNTGRLTYTDATAGSVTLTDSETMNIREPILTIDKSLNQPFPIAAGSTVTYTVVIQHDSTSNWDAYDLVMTDTIPSEYDPTTLSIVGVTASGITPPTASATGGVVRVPDSDTFDLPQGAVVTVTFQAQLAAGYTPGPSIDNTAGVVWTSTDGPNLNERNGGPTGEPDGQDLLDSGVLNDYEVSSTAGFNQADFGDLPDAPYPTTYANSGAHHFLDGVTYLGSGVDADGDGQPTNGAAGDDNDANGDDEDGVQFGTLLTPGSSSDITVTASTAGYLNAWFDWDNDGSLDAGDQVFTDQSLSAGSNVLTINVPAGINPASLYSRFRFTSSMNEATSPNGQAPNGEIEDYVLMSLGDTVWFDNGAGSGTANDGIMNGSEAGIPGVTVELYRATQTPGTDAPIATDTTDANGNYFFYGLPLGDYVVHIPAAEFNGGDLNGLASSAGAGDANVNNDQNVDENGVDEPNPPANGVSSASTTLTPGTELLDRGNSNPTIDFGFVEVDWGDLPSAAYETTLADNGARHLIDGTTYLGAGVDAEMDGQPHNAALGDDNDGNDDEDGVVFLDPLIPGRDARIEVTAGSDGYLNAWIDFNADGTVAAGDQVAADMQLTTGTHIITVTVPADASGIDTIYSRFRFTSYDPAGNVSFTGLANDGEVEDYALVSLGNRVWFDGNANGTQDAGEIGLNGVTLNLLDSAGIAINDANGNPITTTTSGGGYYYFGGLPEGSYIVEVAPDNWNVGNIFGTGGAYEGVLGSAGQGTDNGVDTDDNGNNDDVAAINNGMQSGAIELLLNNEPTTEDGNANSDLTIDFGVYTPVSIGSYVWLDADNNGSQNVGETGIDGAVMVLLVTTDGGATFNPAVNTTGTAVSSQTTSGGGLYNFTDLPPGDYVVRTAPPAGYLPSTTQNAANNDDAENDSNIAISASGVYTSGLFTLTSSGEPVESGTYAGDGQDNGLRDADGNMTVDFGFFRPVNVGDYVWIDANADGAQDAGENGLPGATVELFDGAGNPVTDVNGSSVISQTTGADGLYNFTNLRPGDYIVRVTPPAGYLLTTGGADPDDDINTDSNGYDTGSNIESYAVTLASGSEPASGVDGDGTDGNLTVDFGFYQLAAIGDYVWYDRNADGDQGNDVPADGINGVTVNLYRDVDGDGVAEPGGDDGAAISTTVTADNGGNPGYYLFDNLTPDDYFIEFVPPAGYDISPQDAAADGQDSDADPNTAVTIVTSLVSGENDLTWDAGMYQPASIGDYVWLDANQDGIQDAGEYGVPGVTVTLYNSGNNVVGITTTDFAGAYSFTDLPPGDYHVEVTLPAGYTAAPQDQGADEALDSDINISGVMAVTTLDANENDPTWDAGIYTQPASIGDFVWLDADQDGIQDGNEYGISGVTVNLYDGSGNPLGATTTDANGGYNFTNLPPGDYFVEVVPPAGYTIVAQDQGGDDNLDSDIDQTTGSTVLTTLTSGEDDPTWDGGLYIQPASLGDYVWLDTDQNGVQDADEYGILGVTVELYDSGDNLIGTTTTDITGFYQFTNLPPGDYYVAVTPPTGYTITLQDQGGDDTVDSDIDQTTGRTITTTLAAGENDPTWDGGLYIDPAALGNYVWLDADLDGIQDTDENGIQNVTVNLYDGSGNTLLGTTQTNVFGGYGFDNLPPGDYVVEIVPPATYTVTLQNQGGDPALDSDIDPNPASPTYGRTTTITLVSGQTDLTWDGGLFAQRAAIGDLVWLDVDADGVQDPGENGISGVTVTLYDDATNTALLTTTTSITGTYLFDNLPAGNYYVTVMPPVGYAISPQDQGGDDTLDSDIDGTGGMISTTLAANERQMYWDAGLYQPVSLGNRVWFDANGDGVQDAGENSIPGVELALFQSDGVTPVTDASGNPVGNVTTDASGYYTFTNLVPGDYVVEVVADNWTTGVFSAGGTYPGAVGSPGSGADNQDNTDDNGLVDGTAVFSGVQSGVITLTSNGEPVSEDPQETTPDNNSDLTIDFGFYQPVSLGNYVWLDDNADGVQDTGELPIQGVELALYQGGGTTPAVDVDGNAVGNVMTDASGYYNFTNLPPGDYVVEVIGSNWITGIFSAGGTYPGAVGSPGNGADDQNNTDDNGDNDGLTGAARSGVITLTSNGEPVSEDPQETTPDGSSDLTIDFGFYQKASLGNYVWLDQPVDGLQNNPAANGMNGVTVNLYDGSGTLISTTVTADDGSGNPGYYLFADLTPDDYSVEFVPPAGYAITLQDAGADDALDSDSDRTTGATIVTTLTSGEADLTWDAGLYEYASIGDYVWLDANANGVQEYPEQSIENVLVELYDSTGTLVMTTTTAFNGSYLFTGLIPGDYYLVFYPPAGYAITLQDAGTDDALDSDVDPATGATIVTTLDPGENDLTWDAGVFPINPAIDIEKSVSIARIAPNQTATVTYTLQVTNTGNLTLNTVNITDTLPAGMSYVSGSASIAPTNVAGQDITWNDVTGGVPFAPGDSLTITFEASVDTQNTGTYVNNAEVVGTYPPDNNYPGGQVDDRDDVSVVIEDPSVALDKEVVAPGIVDGVITFSIRITNTGPTTIDVLPMVDTFVGPMEYAGGSPVADTIDNVNGSLAWNDLTTTFGDLPPGQSILIETAFRLTTTATEVTLENTAQVINPIDVYTNPANQPIDTVTLVNVPTAVTLSSFSVAWADGNDVQVSWVTESELDNAFFKVYRSQTDDFDTAALVTIVASQVPGGSGPGTSYEYLDTVPERTVWYYWLVDVDSNGVETVHGPESAAAATTNNYTVYLPIVIRP